MSQPDPWSPSRVPSPPPPGWPLSIEEWNRWTNRPALQPARTSTPALFLGWVLARRKAIAGAVVPFLVVLGAGLWPDSDRGTAISIQEAFAAVVAGLSCGTVVYRIPNGSRRP